MSVPGASPPPERRAGGPLEFGPHQLSARIAEGRRTTAYLIAPAPQAPAQVLRLAKPEYAQALRAETPGEVWIQANDAWGLVQGLVVGESLATVLERFLGQRRALPLPVALTVAMGVAARLDARSAPHLDLLPQHVLLGYDGQVHLIDAAPPQGRAQAAGREGYRAPEHIEGDPLDTTTDVFMLGILLFEMSTGTRLFDPEEPDLKPRIAAARVPRPRDIVGDGYPIELQLVLRKLMRPSRAGRFPSARATQDALRLVATTRSDIGPGPLSTWMHTEFTRHHDAWARLVGSGANLAPQGPLDVRPRAPSRAQTRPSSFLNSGAPTIEELRLDNSTLEAVRRRIMEDGASTQWDKEQEALRAEVGQMKLRRTQLPALSAVRSDGTQPQYRPQTDLNEQTLQDGDFPPMPAPAPAAPARHRPKGLASSPPPMMVPELPTEVSRRFAPLPQPLGLEPSDSRAATSLDELEAAPFLVAEIDMLGPAEPTHDELPSFDASAAAPADWSPPRPPPRIDSLSDLTPEGLMASPTTDRTPAPAAPPQDAPELHPVPKLSEDLVLEPVPPAARAAGSWASQLLDLPDEELPEEALTPLVNSAMPTADPAPSPEADEDEHGDTIQDDLALELLGAEDLARLQRAVEILPSPGPSPDGDPPEAAPEAMQDAPTPPSPAAPPVSSAFVGSVGGASGEGFVASARPPAPLNLGVSDAPEHRQAQISTQVVRDRVVSNDAPPQVEPVSLFRERPPLLSEDDDLRGTSPTPHLDLGPPRSSSSPEDDETSSTHLVIPISDAELAKTERGRGRRGLWLVLLLGLVLAAGLTGYGVGLFDLPALDLPRAADPKPPPPARRPEPAPPQAASDSAPGALPPGPAAPPAEVPSTDPTIVGDPAEPEAEVEPEAAAEPEAEVEPEAEGLADPRPAPSPSTAQASPRSAHRGRRSAEPAPRPAPRVADDFTWRLTLHALPEGATIRVNGHAVATDSVVMLSGRKPVAVRISHPGYQTMTATITAEPDVERHFILRKMR